MAAMRREKQYDMFDVATGACTLGDYLTQRYSENDLSSSFWIEEKDEVDELRAPKPLPDGRPGTEPVVVPIQGPRAPTKPVQQKKPQPPEGLTPDRVPVDRPSQGAQPTSTDGLDSIQKGESGGAPGMEKFQQSRPPEAPSLETFQPSLEGQEQSAVSEDKPTSPQDQAPSMEALLARFHQATAEYKNRAGSVQGDVPDSKPDEPSTDEAQTEGA